MAKQSLTLRQIEVVRAVLTTGSLAGAARLLNVAAPGLSRLIRHMEESLGFHLFDRVQGRLVPTARSQRIFDQIDAIFGKIDDLRDAVQGLERGRSQELKFGCVPSISNVMAPRAMVRLLKLHPELRLDIEIVKIEDALDYLLLGKGEVVALSHRVDHPGLHFEKLASARVMCIVPEGHELARQDSVSARDIVRHPLVGIDTNDPYGRILCSVFTDLGLSYNMTIRARFGATICSLVRAGLGLAVIDQFSVAYGFVPGVKVLPIEEAPSYDTWVASKVGAPLSPFATSFIGLLRKEMEVSSALLK